MTATTTTTTATATAATAVWDVVGGLLQTRLFEQTNTQREIIRHGVKQSARMTARGHREG